MAVADSGSTPAWNVLRPMRSSSGCTRDRVRGTARDDAELACCREIGTAEHRRGHEHLAGLRVRSAKGANSGDAVMRPIAT